MAYEAKWTAPGLAALAYALANDETLEFLNALFSHTAVTPGETVVGVFATAPINLKELDPDVPDQVRIESKLDAATGGDTIRAIALTGRNPETDVEEQWATASTPDIYKPNLADGVSVDFYARVLLQYANAADLIELTQDLNVAVASRFYVDERDAEETAARSAADADLDARLDDLEPRVEALEEREHFDEFVGSALDTGKWLLAAGAGVTTVSDHAAGGSGALQLAATSGDQTQDVQTRSWVIGTKNFRFEARVRYTVQNTGASFAVGLVDGGGTYAALNSIPAENSGRWTAYHGVTPTKVDTVSYSPSTTYQTLVIRRIDGVLQMYIDGNVVLDVSLSTALNNAAPKLYVDYDSADATLRVDYVKFRVWE